MDEGYYTCAVCGVSEQEICENGNLHIFRRFKHPGPVGSLDPIDIFFQNVGF